MRLTNIDIANRLNLSQSTVSRMRKGTRLASLETLYAIAQTYNVNSEVLLAAASKAQRGDKTDWVDLLEDIFDDGELDPDAPPEPEPSPVSVVTPEFSG